MLKVPSTIFFSIMGALNISFFAAAFISFSNHNILPKVDKRFWYPISFVFSFLSGAMGFAMVFWFFQIGEYPIIKMIRPYWIHISVTLGFLTLLIGLILHLFIAMKYKNESIHREILDSKLKALENELNPHFLFNALNSISELVYIDQKRSESTLIQLSTFLRNAIKQESLIPVSTELKMVQNYVHIENIRFDEKILLHINITPEIMTKVVPKFSIQLLVENAIKHGFENETINIHIYNNANTLHVSNDGKICDVVKYGTGLSNLQKRLQLLKVGNLVHNIKDATMVFSIQFHKDSPCVS